MKAIVQLIILMSVILISAKCKKNDYHREIIIKNNSNSKINFSVSLDYPDTTLPCPFAIFEINAGGEYSDWVRDGWETYIFKPQYYQLFILDPHIVDSLTCDSISKNHLIIKRYQLSVDDLNSMNWIVNYP
jgi:hypothetical protein